MVPSPPATSTRSTSSRTRLLGNLRRGTRPVRGHNSHLDALPVEFFDRFLDDPHPGAAELTRNGIVDQNCILVSSDTSLTHNITES